MFFLEPGARQVIRVGLPSSQAAPATAERAFRIYLTEVPPERAAEGSALRVAMRIGVPVFVSQPDARAAPMWTGSVGADGTTVLTLQNPGGAHVRAADVRLLPPSGEGALGTDKSMRYVLAGSRQSWRFVAPQATPGPARVVALMEDGVREFPVVLEAH